MPAPGGREGRRPSPNPEFGGFEALLARGRIGFPRCLGCGRFHWYPMKRCPHCRSRELEWHPVSGEGRLYSWSVVHHRFDPELPLAPPYVVALVEFDDAPGVRLVTNLEEADPSRLAIGMRLEPFIEQGVGGAPPRVFFRSAAVPPGGATPPRSECGEGTR